MTVAEIAEIVRAQDAWMECAPLPPMTEAEGREYERQEMQNPPQLGER